MITVVVSSDFKCIALSTFSEVILDTTESTYKSEKTNPQSGSYKTRGKVTYEVPDPIQ